MLMIHVEVMKLQEAALFLYCRVASPSGMVQYYDSYCKIR